MDRDHDGAGERSRAAPVSRQAAQNEEQRRPVIGVIGDGRLDVRGVFGPLAEAGKEGRRLTIGGRIDDGNRQAGVGEKLA